MKQDNMFADEIKTSRIKEATLGVFSFIYNGVMTVATKMIGLYRWFTQ